MCWKSGKKQKQNKENGLNIREAFQKAFNTTEVIRQRQACLLVASATEIPFILLSESEINDGDTVVREGKVDVEKPIIMVPGRPYDFDGFEAEESRLALFGRIASFPTGKYSIECDMRVVDTGLQRTVDKFQRQFDSNDDEHTGLCVCKTDVWELAALYYVGLLVRKSIGYDWDDLRRRLEQQF